MKFLKIFSIGLLISFLGSLPLGTLNIAAMQISISDGIIPALYFALGSLLVEIIYVRISLVAMDWVRKQKRLFLMLEWVTVFIILALAFFSFYAALENNQTSKNILLSSTLHRFWLGVTMSAVNPVQIPFWFGWSTVLFTKKILLPQANHYNIYIIGIGIGTLIGNAVFIFGGRLMVEKLNTNQNILNWIIGGIFLITALIQLWRMWQKRDAMHKL
jgi:threonine/homoserine/homoserine lactone efflux protein